MMMFCWKKHCTKCVCVTLGVSVFLGIRVSYDSCLSSLLSLFKWFQNFIQHGMASFDLYLTREYYLHISPSFHDCFVPLCTCGHTWAPSTLNFNDYIMWMKPEFNFKNSYREFVVSQNSLATFSLPPSPLTCW